MMDEEACCPRCRTTKYRNPNLKLMVNVCGHALCEACVELLFVRGSGTCPVCNITLRRINFRLQYFEDSSIEKEIEIRKKILRDFNMKEDDFSSLREYNNYLEEVEEIIFNLVNDVDVESTRKKVEAYRRDNKELIAKNKFKRSADDMFIENCIALESANKNQGSTDAIKKLALEQLEKQKERQALINDLMFSDASATEILKNHAEVQRLKEIQMQEQAKADEKAAKAQNLVTQFGQQTTFIPIPVKAEALYIYENPRIEYLGPEPPLIDDIHHKGYLKNIRAAAPSEKAGGYESWIGCYKALMSAVDGLYLHDVTTIPAHIQSPASDDHSSSDRSASDDMDID